MLSFKHKLGASVAAATLFASSIAPAFAADLEISGNGRDSYNKIKVYTECNQEVTQANSTYIYNNVSVKGSTGGNSANDNLGGDVTIDTGDADSTVDITNNGSSNDATVPSCCCDEQSSESSSALISGNGKNSTNKIKKLSKKSSSTLQVNETELRNRVRVKGKTGKNYANDNLGGGSVDVLTGNTDSEVTITNSSGSNTLN